MSYMNLKSLEVSSTSGNAEINEVNSTKAIIKNTSGSILLKNSNFNNVETRVISGRIYINDVTGNISGKSISGSVNIDVEKLEGNIEFKLTSGKFTLNLASKEINSSITLNTTSGRVSCDYPITVRGSVGKNSLVGISGTDKYKIDVSNTSGSLYIIKK